VAGDWIKMRVDLQSHPKVVRILSATQSDKFRVIGGLHAVWGVFDAHSENGILTGYTLDLMDHIIGWSGFSRALESVNWLLFDGVETLQMPEFTEHNGQSAKRRAEDQKRKKNERKRPQNVRIESGQKSDDVRTREEKRREDIKELTPVAPSGKPLLADEVLKIPVRGGEYSVRQDFVDTLSEAYPVVDVPQTLKEIRAWCLANPARQKTPKGASRFINSWCERIQNRG